MSQRLLNAWQTRGLLAGALWPLSLLYGALVRLRRIAYRRSGTGAEHLPVPVLVVGNVIVGGAGKTPTVIALVQHLRERGWTPGVISRGHGRRAADCLLVQPGSHAEDIGDEPALIRHATDAPMAVGRHRVEAGRLLLQKHPEVDIIVSDDGMQHLALARDLTVVVFDERGVGNGWLLPAGMLREPWPLQGTGHGRTLVLRTLRSGRPIADLPPLPGDATPFLARRELGDHARNPGGETRALSDWHGQAVGAFAGIAQPALFFDMLRARGLQLHPTLSLPDHAPAEDMGAALEPGRPWLCTEKDAVKLFPLLGQRPDLEVWTVPLEQTVEPAFWHAFDQAMQPFEHRRRLSSTPWTPNSSNCWSAPSPKGP